jgi:hypothetical protein
MFAHQKIVPEGTTFTYKYNNSVSHIFTVIAKGKMTRTAIWADTDKEIRIKSEGRMGKALNHIHGDKVFSQIYTSNAFYHPNGWKNVCAEGFRHYHAYTDSPYNRTWKRAGLIDDGKTAPILTKNKKPTPETIKGRESGWGFKFPEEPKPEPTDEEKTDIFLAMFGLKHADTTEAEVKATIEKHVPKKKTKKTKRKLIIKKKPETVKKVSAPKKPTRTKRTKSDMKQRKDTSRIKSEEYLTDTDSEDEDDNTPFSVLIARK